MCLYCTIYHIFIASDITFWFAKSLEKKRISTFLINKFLSKTESMKRYFFELSLNIYVNLVNPLYKDPSQKNILVARQFIELLIDKHGKYQIFLNVAYSIQRNTMYCN